MANDAVTKSHDAERTCDKCGRTFKSDGAWYAKHALKCDGTKPATAGRIAQPAHADRTPPATRRHAKPRRVVQRRKTKSKRAVSRPGRPARRSPAQRKSVDAVTVTVERATLVDARDLLLTELRAKVDLLTTAIKGLEALG